MSSQTRLSRDNVPPLLFWGDLAKGRHNQRRLPTDFSIQKSEGIPTIKVHGFRRKKSGGQESKSPSLDFSKWGFALGGVQSGMDLGGRIEGKSVGAEHAFD
jgi:hypothetical protein